MFPTLARSSGRGLDEHQSTGIQRWASRLHLLAFEVHRRRTDSLGRVSLAVHERQPIDEALSDRLHSSSLLSSAPRRCSVEKQHLSEGRCLSDVSLSTGQFHQAIEMYNYLKAILLYRFSDKARVIKRESRRTQTVCVRTCRYGNSQTPMPCMSTDGRTEITKIELRRDSSMRRNDQFMLSEDWTSTTIDNRR